MKTITCTALFILLATVTNIKGQTDATPEKYGSTLNLGVGVGYYGYLDQNTPVLHADFEFDIAKNLTLAPFISIYTYQNHYYWGGPQHTYRDYSYRQTVVPVGAKVTYYFDQLFKANSKWDFYAAGSLGIAFRKTTWESDYTGDYVAAHGSSGLYLDAHAGAEFHMTQKLGLFLDLSTGVSTFGLAVHF